MDEKLWYSDATFMKTETLLKCLKCYEECAKNHPGCLLDRYFKLLNYGCLGCPLDGVWEFRWENRDLTYDDRCYIAYEDIKRELDRRGVDYKSIDI